MGQNGYIGLISREKPQSGRCAGTCGQWSYDIRTIIDSLHALYEIGTLC